jgi:hypothetical protein
MSPRAAAFFWCLLLGVGAVRHGRKEATRVADDQSSEGDEMATDQLSEGDEMATDENLTSQGVCNYNRLVLHSKHVRCNNKDCRLPRAFQIADAFGEMYLQSYANMGDVKWSHSEGGSWYDYVTRLWVDKNYNNVRKQCSCNPNCNDRFNWAKIALGKVTKCRYPGGYWKKLFAVLNPRSTYTYTETVERGRTFSQSQSFTETVGMDVSVATDVFGASSSFSYVANQQSVDVWSKKTTQTRKWEVHKGESVVAWQYVLTCIGFNRVGMPIQKVSFVTKIQQDTATLSPPTCNPNRPASCGR